MASEGDNKAYAAGQAREFLRDDLGDKENEYIHEHAGLIDDPRVVKFLNYQISLWADAGRDYTKTSEYRKIVESAATLSMDEAFREGNVSQLQGAVGLVDHSAGVDDAMMTMARALSMEGAIVTVTGAPGAGKTAMILDVSRVWAANTGGAIVGNVGSWDGLDAEATTNQELWEAMESVKGPTLGIIDEAAQHLNGRGDRADSAEVADEFKLVRKEGDYGEHPRQGALILIAHTKKGVTAPIRRISTQLWDKPSRQDQGRVVIYESPGNDEQLEKVKEFKGLTDTRETYNEHESSEFHVVLDEDGDEDDVADPDTVRRNEAIKTALRAVANGATYKEAANLIPYADSWVGDRVADYRDGDLEHLDLDVDVDEL